MSYQLLTVAHDISPSRVFSKLISYASSAGISTDFVSLNGGGILPPSDGSLEVKVRAADAVLVGMSSTEKGSEVERTAARACILHNKPFGLFADAHGLYRRPYFAEFRSSANFVFTVSADEAHAAAAMYPQATVFVTGNPLWAEYFEFADRHASRKIVHARDEEFVVLVAGSKDAAHNRTTLMASIRAAILIGGTHIVFCRHPGDLNPADEYGPLAYYGEHAGVRISMPPVKTDALVPGANCVVNGTSVQIHALARQIPFIDYYEASSQDFLERLIGTRVGYFFGSGAVYDVYGQSWEALADAMRSARDDPSKLRTAQESAVQAMGEKESLSSMLRAISSMIRT